MPRERSFSLRTKLALLMSALIGIISIFLIWYLPSRIRDGARLSMIDTATSIAAMGAHGLSESVSAGQPVSGAPILRALRQSTDLVYIVATDLEGAVLSSFNETLAEQSRYATLATAPPPSPQPGLDSEVRGGFTGDRRIYQAIAPIRDRARPVGRLYLGFSMDRHNANVAAGRRAVASSTLLFLAMGVAGSWFLAGLLMAPLEKIVQTTKRIAHGARGERAEVPDGDEVGTLARAFNEMVARIESTQNDLEDLNQKLEQRVTSRTAQFREEFERRLSAQTALLSSEARYASLFDRNLAGVYVATTGGRIVSANPACAHMFGFESTEEFIESGRITYRDPDKRARVINQLLHDGVLSNLEIELVRRDGTAFWALENARFTPEEALIEGIVLDITERKLSELEIEYRAHHDPLTGLPNRSLLQDRLHMAIESARRLDLQVAVIFLDIDDLKGVNDVLGHQIGDQVLQQVGQRLSGVVRSSDTVARFGGDEFVIILPDLRKEDSIHDVAETLRQSLESPIAIEDEVIFVTASIGASIFPRDGDDAEALLQNADSMMYRVKIRGGDGVLSYTAGESSKGIRRMSLEGELRTAIDLGQIVPYYQPQYDLETRELTGVEALVRWNHPEGDVVEPAGFIALAEQTGLIVPLGELVLRRACQDLKTWQHLSPRMQMAINVSARQFHQKDFLGVVNAAIREANVDPDLVELEITESIALQRSGWTVELLEQIRKIGIRIAVDDFGTGRSSLMYLKKFPIDTVKIDQEFIRGMMINSHDHSIVTAILLLSENLGLRTIAEGIELEEQCEHLRASGCSQGQGFLFSPAVPAAAIEELLARMTADRGTA